ncbi:MAG: efflux RND transporter permease subunit [Nitrospirota bacterium]|nr:efflux RND transporter permease subunit [Nitrospirota bacterium]
MIDALLAFSLRQRVLVVVLACVLAGGGLYAFQFLAIDAFPDVTNVQVQVLAEAHGLSPVEVERLITFPIELQMTGLPGLTEIRSLSKFGLAQVTAVFRDDMDVYFARQLVLERLIEAGDRLPDGVVPLLAPVTTGLGEVYQYVLAGPDDAGDAAGHERRLMEQRTVQDWTIRPLLKSVPGVIDVNSIGGFVKQYQVLVNPAALRKYDLALHDVFDAVAKNNANAGGNILKQQAEQYIVRGVGLIRTVEDIENIVVKEARGTPVFVRDVAEVRIGHAVRYGAAVLNGKQEAVSGIVLMLRGANAREVVDAVKRKVDELHLSRALPGGLRIVPYYDRSELVTAALHTVRKALLEGIVFVVLVLFAFLGNVRSALIVSATLLIAPLATFIVMGQVGLSANLMSLGGLAIAIGMMVDGSVVLVENVYRQLSAHRGEAAGRWEIVLRASREVGQPVVFGVVIIIIVFLPLFSLQGMEGKLFAPMAHTIMIALLVSLGLSLTLSPVLCALAMKPGREDDTLPVRWAKRVYVPALRWALRHRAQVLGGAVALLTASLLLVPSLGTEFIPILDEGALTPQIVRLPSVSLDESIELEKRAHQAILAFPEVRMVVGKIGRPEIANDPMDPNESDPVVTLHPRETWTTAGTKAELVDAMRQRLAEVLGISVLMSQPIQQRVDELISGVKSEIAIKLFGDDLGLLKTKAEQIEAIMKTVKGVKDVKVEQVTGQSYLTVEIDRHRIARHGINVADIQEIIETAVAGKPATKVLEGERRFALVVRFPEPQRNSVEAIGNILIKDPSGALIPLSDLATIEVQEGPVRIGREQVRRRIVIGLNVVGRDIGSVVEEGQRKLEANLALPPGYTVTWGGAFENMQRAMARLRIIVPATIGLIFLLLFSAFNSVRYAGLIILNLPFSLIGGIVALWLTGEYLSVPASVGFIALFGVAVLNGIVLVSCINTLRQDGLEGDDAIVTGCVLRLRPVLMTALVTLLGLLPMAFAQGIGAEVQRPLALVVIGGLVSSTLLTLIVLPALYRWFEEPKDAAAR